MAEAVRRGGAWIACRPGCCECCLGPFSISQSDVLRLREGLSRIDEAVAQRIRQRAADYIAAIDFCDDDGLPEGMDDTPCPVLDPATGCCDLYDSRPITCRTFGPAIKAPNGAIATCELCFEGASEEELAACAVEIGEEALEDDGEATIVAFAICPPEE